MTFAVLAWRNIWRHPKRTVLTLLAAAFAGTILVFFTGLQLSSYDASISAVTKLYTGHLQVQIEGYSAKPQMELALKNPLDLAERIRKHPLVTAVAVRGNGFAIASSTDRSYGAQVVGVEPTNEPLVSTIPNVIRSGRYLSSTSEEESVIGSTLARNLKISVGDSITLLGQGSDGSLAATVVPVVGLFESGSRDFDRGLIQLPLAYFQDVFSMQNRAHSIVVSSSNLDELGVLQSELANLVAPFSSDTRALSVLRWDQILPGLKQAIELDLASSWLFYLSLIVIVAFSVLNTFLMSILERTREFGIMMAIGCNARNIFLMLLLEAFLLTTTGIVLGIACGSALILYFGAVGFSIPGAEEIAKAWNLPAMLFPKLSAPALLFAPSVILAASLLSILYPALCLWKLTPANAVRKG